MKMCLFSLSDSCDTVLSKIKQIYHKDMTILRATKSGDLFNVDSTLDGKELLDFVGNGCLYVKQKIKPSATVSPTVSSTNEGILHNYIVNWELLKLELQDRALMYSYRMDSDQYAPNKEDDDDLCENVRKQLIILL